MTFRISMCLFSLLLAAACTEDSWRDTNAPPTFGDACGENPDVCEAPFSCLEGDALQVPFCSNSCEADTDCPSWIAVGHCAGPTQSTCDDVGICNPVLCK